MKILEQGVGWHTNVYQPTKAQAWSNFFAIILFYFNVFQT
jgi:hypothetical protein